MADIEQLELELHSIQNKYSDDISIHQYELQTVTSQVERFNDLKLENESLKKSIEVLEEEMNKERNDHASKMHEMNRAMRILRQNMESKLLRELTALDVFYQKEAFDGLPEEKKKAMFENAKLKDEVALQGIGMANLGSRLIKQTFHFENCQKEWKSLDKRSHALREKLSELTLVKNNLTQAQQKEEEEIESLMAEQQQLTAELDEVPSQEELTLQKQELQAKIRECNEQTNMWENRLTLLEKLLADIRPSNSEEAKGHYNSKIFTFRKEVLTTLPTALKRRATTHGHIDTSECSEQLGVASVGSEEAAGVKPTDLAILTAEDASLAAAMLPLKGKESYLVKTYSNKGGSEEVDQNMVAWVVLEIINIWKSVGIEPSSDQDKSNTVIEEGKLLFSQLENGVAAEDSSSNHLLEPSQSSIDFASDFEVGSSVFQTPSVSWVKKIPSIQRIPPPDMHLIQTVKKIKSQNVFLTALQSPYQLYEVGPPVIMNSIVDSDLPDLAPRTQTAGIATLNSLTGTSSPIARPESSAKIRRSRSEDPLKRSGNSNTFLHPLFKKELPSAEAKTTSLLIPIHKIREKADRRSKTTALSAHPLEVLTMQAYSTSALRRRKESLWN